MHPISFGIDQGLQRINIGAFQFGEPPLPQNQLNDARFIVQFQFFQRFGGD